jgi:hypothetical protein
MTYATEMGSAVRAYIPSFIKTGSGIQKLIKGYTQTGWRWHKPNLRKWVKPVLRIATAIGSQHFVL